MQEITYEDGEKTKKIFKDLYDALEDAKEKVSQGQPIKKIVIKKIIPKKRRGK